MGGTLLVDISNSFTKLAVMRGSRIGRVRRISTAELSPATIRKALRGETITRVAAASVVPDKNPAVDRAFKAPVCWIGPKTRLGIGIDYPRPASIGADRLANAAGCVAEYGAPAIVVDFGTAVTFDVISPGRAYMGGVIAPGLGAMTEYLHRRTALLPLITLREPLRAVGRSTREAMLSGAVHGYRGLVREILERITAEVFPAAQPLVIATGGDAGLISAAGGLFSVIDPLLTLKGLQVAARLNFPS